MSRIIKPDSKLMTMYAEPRIKQATAELAAVYGKQSTVIHAALLGFLRSSDVEQTRMVKEWAEFKANPRAAVRHRGIVRTA